MGSVVTCAVVMCAASIVAVPALLGPAHADEAAAPPDVLQLIEQEFIRFDPDYKKKRDTFSDRLDEISGKLRDAQAGGNALDCSQQMYLEARWLHHYTASWDELEDLLDRIEISLSDNNQAFAREQLPTTGGWGMCYDRDFLKLEATLAQLDDLHAQNLKPRYEVKLKAGTSGKTISEELEALLISDISSNGVDTRGEFGNLLTTLAQGIFKPYFRHILEHDVEVTRPATMHGIEDGFRFFVAGAQDPETGYWGTWYLVEGDLHKAIDLSFTFHIIHYSKGSVSHWPKIIDTTMAIRDAQYPYGWKSDGDYTSHNLYDVVTIFRYGWQHMDDDQKSKVSSAIKDMLHWFVTTQVNDDGTFKQNPEYFDSFSDVYYFGIGLLDQTGYWDPDKRFWTNDALPADIAGKIDCQALKSRVQSYKFTNWAGVGAMERLNLSCPAA